MKSGKRRTQSQSAASARRTAVASSPFPNELLVEILQDVPVLTMVRCRLVSHQFKAVVDGTPVLQYRLELFLAGVLPGERHMDITDALREATRRRHAWNTLQPSHSVVLSQHRPHIRTFTAQNVVAVQVDEGLGVSSYIFNQLSPTPQWGLPKMWKVLVKGFVARTLAMCPEQDLLILAVQSIANGWPTDQTNLHVLTLSTGTPHPSAQAPIIRVTNAHHGTAEMSIFGDLLGYMTTGALRWVDGSEIWVMNWKTGRCRLNMYHKLEHGVNPTFSAISFTFLENGLLLLPVIEVQGDFGGDAAIYVYDCKTTVPKRRPYQDIPRLTTFRLPQPDDDADFDLFYVSAAAPGAPHPAHGAPTGGVPDPAGRVLAFQMHAGRYAQSFLPLLSLLSPDPPAALRAMLAEVRREPLLLFVHAGALQQHCARWAPGAEFEWEEWAGDARLVRGSGGESVWIRNLVGHRGCFVPEDLSKGKNEGESGDWFWGSEDDDGESEDEGEASEEDEAAANAEDGEDESKEGASSVGSSEPHFWLYDFSSPPALRHAASTNPGPWKYVLEPEELDLDLFSEPIVSYLPYRKVRTGIVVTPDTEAKLVADALVSSAGPDKPLEAQLFL